MHYDRGGKSITMEEWALKLNDPGYCLVNRNVIVTLSDRYRISTVWIGADYSYGNGTPIIFETMIFTTDDLLTDWCWRYATEKEAWIGHAHVVAMVEDYLINGKLPD